MRCSLTSEIKITGKNFFVCNFLLKANVPFVYTKQKIKIIYNVSYPVLFYIFISLFFIGVVLSVLGHIVLVIGHKCMHIPTEFKSTW